MPEGRRRPAPGNRPVQLVARSAASPALADKSARRCHIAVPRARSVGTSGIIMPLRLRSATCSSRQREVRGAYGLRREALLSGRWILS